MAQQIHKSKQQTAERHEEMPAQTEAEISEEQARIEANRSKGEEINEESDRVIERIDEALGFTAIQAAA